MTHLQIVKGYICFDCADVALAQKGENPAHPPGSPSNPTGDTPNGPYPLTGTQASNPLKASPDGTQGFDDASGLNGASPSDPGAYQFGGALAGLNLPAGSNAAPTSQPYRAGTTVSLFA